MSAKFDFEKEWLSKLDGFTKAELKDRVQTQWKYRGFTLATSVLAIMFGIAAIVLGALAYSYLQYDIAPAFVRGSGPIPPTPYVFYVDAGSAAAMVLPNDLSAYVGKVIRIWSRTSQAHTLTIDGFGSTFDGLGNTVQFGGAIGDGVVFEVILPNLVVTHILKGSTIV